MTNAEIVILLRNVAAALLIKGENRFRIIAYDKAADSIEHLTSEVKDIWDEGKLEDIPGVGKTIADYLDELMRTGHVKHFETILADFSPALFTLLLIPGIGPKKAYRLTEEFNIRDVKTAAAELKKVALEGKIAPLDGFGEKSQAEILSSIEIFEKGQIKENRMPFPYADTLAQEVIDYLKKHKDVIQVDRLGSMRRKVATIGDIDLAASTNNPKAVVEHFLAYPKRRKIIDSGDKGATILLSVGRQVDLRVAKPVSYGAMLQYFTGSKHHNITLRELALRKGLSLSEHGIKVLKKVDHPRFTPKNYNKDLGLYEFATEEDFYAAVDMPWIPPEIREDAGEIAAAQNNTLPKLVTSEDIRGDLHIHSDYDLKSSHDMGASPLEELLTNAEKRGYAYIGLSDHNPSMSTQREDEVVTVVKTRREKLEQLYSSWKHREKNRVQMFTMLEVDILPTGRLALPEKAFDYVDAVIVSVHSSFRMPRDTATERILKALAHPKVKILGHPTGRMIGTREGLDANWPKVFEYAAEHNKAMEINAWHERLDLPDLLVRQARTMGVKFVIDTDSHHVDHMANMHYGVDVAKRGWCEKKDILNTMEYNELSSWLKS